MGVRVRAALRLICAISILSVAGWAQLARYDGFVAPAGYNFGPANIAVCQAGGSGGPPCTPQALIYADATGKYQISQPFQADINGHYYFYAPSGSYVTDTYGSGYATTLTNISIGVGAVPTLSGSNSWTGAQNVFLPSVNTPCSVGQTPGAQICTFSDNSTFINVTSRNGLYSVALDSDADGEPDISAPVGGSLVAAGLEFCGNGCGTANEIFVFPQGTATSSTQFNGMTFQLASDVWNGSTSAYDIYGIQAIQGGGTNPQTALEFTAGSGSSGFHSAFFTYPVQIGTLSVYGDNARFNLKATSGNPSEVFYDHNNTAAYTVGEFGRMSVNNCQVGGASGTASPAACGASSTGIVAVPSSQTTYTVNTTAVDANSEIFLEQMSDNSGLSGSPACSATAANPIQLSRVAGTSFTFTLTSVAAVTCFKYWIVN